MEYMIVSTLIIFLFCFFGLWFILRNNQIKKEDLKEQEELKKELETQNEKINAIVSNHDNLVKQRKEFERKNRR